MLLDGSGRHAGIYAKMPIAFFYNVTLPALAVELTLQPADLGCLIGESGDRARRWRSRQPGRPQRGCGPAQRRAPLPQHERLNPKLGRDLRLRSPTAFQEGRRLAFERGGERPTRLRHKTPPSPRKNLSEMFAKPREDHRDFTLFPLPAALAT